MLQCRKTPKAATWLLYWFFQPLDELSVAVINLLLVCLHGLRCVKFVYRENIIYYPCSSSSVIGNSSLATLSPSCSPKLRFSIIVVVYSRHATSNQHSKSLICWGDNVSVSSLKDRSYFSCISLLFTANHLFRQDNTMFLVPKPFIKSNKKCSWNLSEKVLQQISLPILEKSHIIYNDFGWWFHVG